MQELAKSQKAFLINPAVGVLVPFELDALHITVDVHLYSKK